MARRRRRKYMWLALVSGDMPYRERIERELWERTTKIEITHYPSKIPVYRIPAEEREKFDQFIFTEGQEELVYDRILKVRGNDSMGLVFHKYCALEYLITEPFKRFKLVKEGRKVRKRRETQPRRRRRKAA